MTKEWLKIIFAAMFEVGWVIGLKYSDSIVDWGITVVCIIVSFYFLIMSGKKLPVATSYTVFVGLGTAGTVLVDWLYFGEQISLFKLLFLALLLIGVIGLKAMTEDKEEQSEGSAA